MAAGAARGPCRQVWKVRVMVWVLLTSGRGPGECQIAVAGLAQALCAEARAAGVEAEMLDAEDGPHGLLSALLALRA